MTYLGLTWSMRAMMRNLMAETDLSALDMTEQMIHAVKEAYNEELEDAPFDIMRHEGRLEGK